MIFDDYTEYGETIEPEIRHNIGNCKRCIHKSSCGNKNKRESDSCDKYRPEIKIKRRGKHR